MQLHDLDFILKTEERSKNITTKKIVNPRGLPVSEKAILDERLKHVIENSSEPLAVAEERIMRHNDLMSFNFLEKGQMVGKSVCRIHVRNFDGSSLGFGTGFLVSPGLILTNHHIFESDEMALNSLAEFDYEYDIHGNPKPSYLFEFDPETFFETNKELDYSLVAIRPRAKFGTMEIKSFGYLKLYREPNKALISENVTIIQHPGGGYKQIAIRENEITSKDDNFITYQTDTAQGSSGSPVFNDQWQVVALHHSGKPKKDKNGNILCKGGALFKKGMDDSLIDWESNEGIRISRIVKDLIEKNVTGLDDLLDLPQYQFEFFVNEQIDGNHDAVKNNADQPINFIDNITANNMNPKVTFTIPLEISVGIGNAVPSNPTTILPNLQNNAIKDNLPAYAIEKAIDQKYTGRNGYDVNFVKTTNFKMDISDLLKAKNKNLAPLLSQTASNKYLLHYHNFSVAIHKERKLCIMTAVNIDGSRLNPIKRENTKWIMDPRMDKKYQTGPAVYEDNDLDRGHMVRRLDPVWGKNATAANDDTFHFTNSTPQHKDLNQKTWLSLENYILDNADIENIKASVFTGPIFSEDDIPYRGVLLPLQFWKVAAIIKKNGKPSVTGYILKQPDDIEDFRDREGISADGYGKFKTYQVSLQKIAELTGIAFDKFNKYDPLFSTRDTESIVLREISGSKDIQL